MGLEAFFQLYAGIMCSEDIKFGTPTFEAWEFRGLSSMGQKKSKPVHRTEGSVVSQRPFSLVAGQPIPVDVHDRPAQVVHSSCASHRLEDVVDRVTVRVAGNGIAIKVLRTVAWAGDPLLWTCQHVSQVAEEMPETEIGILGLKGPPVELETRIWDQTNGRLVAKGDLVPFLA